MILRKERRQPRRQQEEYYDEHHHHEHRTTSESNSYFSMYSSRGDDDDSQSLPLKGNRNLMMQPQRHESPSSVSLNSHGGAVASVFTKELTSAEKEILGQLTVEPRTPSTTSLQRNIGLLHGYLGSPGSLRSDILLSPIKTVPPMKTDPVRSDYMQTTSKSSVGKNSTGSVSDGSTTKNTSKSPPRMPRRNLASIHSNRTLSLSPTKETRPSARITNVDARPPVLPKRMISNGDEYDDDEYDEYDDDDEEEEEEVDSNCMSLRSYPRNAVPPSSASISAQSLPVTGENQRKGYRRGLGEGALPRNALPHAVFSGDLDEDVADEPLLFLRQQRQRSQSTGALFEAPCEDMLRSNKLIRNQSNISRWSTKLSRSQEDLVKLVLQEKQNERKTAENTASRLDRVPIGDDQLETMKALLMLGPTARTRLPAQSPLVSKTGFKHQKERPKNDPPSPSRLSFLSTSRWQASGLTRARSHGYAECTTPTTAPRHTEFLQHSKTQPHPVDRSPIFQGVMTPALTRARSHGYSVRSSTATSKKVVDRSPMLQNAIAGHASSSTDLRWLDSSQRSQPCLPLRREQSCSDLPIGNSGIKAHVGRPYDTTIKRSGLLDRSCRSHDAGEVAANPRHLFGGLTISDQSYHPLNIHSGGNDDESSTEVEISLKGGRRHYGKGRTNIDIASSDEESSMESDWDEGSTCHDDNDEEEDDDDGNEH